MPVRVSVFAFSIRFASKVKLRQLLIKPSIFICFIRKNSFSIWRILAEKVNFANPPPPPHPPKYMFHCLLFVKNTRSITDNLSLIYMYIMYLTVGSCPKSDKSVQLLFFVLFCVAFKQFYFLNLFLPRKLQDFAENSPFFVHLFPLCWNSNSKNSLVTCP